MADQGHLSIRPNDGFHESLCPACRSGSAPVVETVASEALATEWGRFFPGAETAILKYVADGRMPSQIHMRRCASCGLEFADPPFAGDGEWYAVVPHHAERWEHRRCLDDLRDRPRRIVELGCSAGHFLERARDAGHDVWGLDFDESALDIARSKGLRVHSSDITEAGNWWPDKLDAVVMFQVLEHIVSLDDFFAPLADAMAPGTTLHVSSPNTNRLPHRAEHVGLREMWDYPPHHQTRWSPLALRELLSRHGLQLVHYEQESIPFRPLAVALVHRDAVREGRELEQLSRTHRRWLTLRKMAQIAVAARRFGGGSFYARAVRVT